MRLKRRLVYAVNDLLRLFRFQILSTDETLDLLLTTDVSLARFGDGEMAIMLGRDIHFQHYNPKLAANLSFILKMRPYEDFMVGVPMALNTTKGLNPQASTYWEKNLKTGRLHWLRLANRRKVYLNSSFTWCYVDEIDKEQASESFKRIVLLWESKDVLIIEGKNGRFGVGGGLLSNASSVRRVLCPDKNAFEKYDTIMETIHRCYTDGQLVLLSLGPTATVLAYDLYKEGKRAIDIGHLNNEYQEYLQDNGIIDSKTKSIDTYKNEIVAVIE